MACKICASCKLPVSFNNVKIQMVSYDCGQGEGEIIALIYKSPDCNKDTVPYVRIHSACITGEVFGSQKCDCGDQFDKAMNIICNSEFGIMIYMCLHEGRGIGLTNKIRAYKLQEKGIDTLKANELLGFEHDYRDFSPVINVLKSLNIKKIKLITNNPCKVEAFNGQGVTVTEKINPPVSLNPHNEDYIMTKKKVLKHTFGKIVSHMG